MGLTDGGHDVDRVTDLVLLEGVRKASLNVGYAPPTGNFDSFRLIYDQLGIMFANL
jgi:hypothetical protein